MLLKLIKYLRGYVKIKVEGYSPERLLNLCNVHQILLWDVENQGTAYKLCISVKDYKRLRPLVQKTRTKVFLLEKHGFPFFLYKFRKRKLFFAGMFLCIGAIYVLSLFIWNIQFEGNVTQETAELLTYLETMGVAHGSRKSQIICEDIEINLRKTYPNMLWVSAEMRGTRIIVQIKENTDEDIVSNIEKKEMDDVSIVSDVSGIVESMIVRNGTPLVKKGDLVKKDQVLVEGYYVIKNDAGDVVRYEGTAADADIQILSIENFYDSFSMEYEEKHYTERKRLGIKLCVGEKLYQWIPAIPFEFYETVVKRKDIHITENFYLPFSMIFEWYLEYIPKTEKYDENDLPKLADTRFNEKYKNILQKGVQIIEKDVKIDTNGKLCRVAGTVQLLVPVTKKVPVLIPRLEKDASLEGEN